MLNPRRRCDVEQTPTVPVSRSKKSFVVQVFHMSLGVFRRLKRNVQRMASVERVSHPTPWLCADPIVRFLLRKRATKLMEKVPRENIPNFRKQIITLQDALGTLEPSKIKIIWNPKMVKLHLVSFLATRHSCDLSLCRCLCFNPFCCLPGYVEKKFEHDGNVRTGQWIEGQTSRST